MTDGTTIRLSDDTKQLLDKENKEGESRDETVRRLLGAAEGQLWTDQEIRDIVRDEMETVARQH